MRARRSPARTRALLRRVAEGDVGANAFPVLFGRVMEIARCPRQRRAAILSTKPRFDADGRRMRS